MSEPIEQITDELILVAVEFGIPEHVAENISTAMIERIKKTIGGGWCYIPKTGKKQRNEQIKQRFNGVNHEEVCSEFRISKSTLYRVIGGKD